LPLECFEDGSKHVIYCADIFMCLDMVFGYGFCVWFLDMVFGYGFWIEFM